MRKIYKENCISRGKRSQEQRYRHMAAKRVPFGGMKISFAKCGCSMKDVFGSSDLVPSEMTKKLWKHLKGSHSGAMVKK